MTSNIETKTGPTNAEKEEFLAVFEKKETVGHIKQNKALSVINEIYLGLNLIGIIERIHPVDEVFCERMAINIYKRGVNQHGAEWSVYHNNSIVFNYRSNGVVVDYKYFVKGPWIEIIKDYYLSILYTNAMEKELDLRSIFNPGDDIENSEGESNEKENL